MAKTTLQKLEELRKNNFLEDYQGLKDYVLSDLIETEKENHEYKGVGYSAKQYLKDLSSGGCQSGMVNNLIYYQDTEKFYNEYASEIDQLKDDTEESLGESLKISGNVRNFLAWFAYEEIARQLADELGFNN